MRYTRRCFSWWQERQKFNRIFTKTIPHSNVCQTTQTATSQKHLWLENDSDKQEKLLKLILIREQSYRLFVSFSEIAGTNQQNNVKDAVHVSFRYFSIQYVSFLSIS